MIILSVMQAITMANAAKVVVIAWYIGLLIVAVPMTQHMHACGKEERGFSDCLSEIPTAIANYFK